MDKKELRNQFRSEVFARDGFRCVMCGFQPSNSNELDAHHITDRHLLPNGGYVCANGITLCTDRSKDASNCHAMAEMYHATGFAHTGFSPPELYTKIGSDYRRAFLVSIRLSQPSFAPDRLNEIICEELLVCAALGCTPCRTSWELACDSMDEMDSDLLNYWKGRYQE